METDSAARRYGRAASTRPGGADFAPFQNAPSSRPARLQNLLSVSIHPAGTQSCFPSLYTINATALLLLQLCAVYMFSSETRHGLFPYVSGVTGIARGRQVTPHKRLLIINNGPLVTKWYDNDPRLRIANRMYHAAPTVSESLFLEPSNS